MALLHLIDSAFFRDPYGAVQVSTDVTLRVVCFPDTDENISHEGDLSDVTSGIFLKLRYRFRDKSGSEYLNTYSVSSELPEEESIVRSIFYETDRLYDKRGAKVYTFVLDGEKLSRSGTYFYSFYIDGAESPEYQLTVSTWHDQ